MRAVFLGPPGVGKGTYASRVSTQLGVPHISTGDLLREDVKKGTDVGKKAKKYMEAGGLVPAEIVVAITKNRLNQKDCKNGYILDGFPRSLDQAKALEDVKMDVVVNFLQKDSILIRKISGRRICRNCGDIYNMTDINEDGIKMPPMLPKKEGVCDKCGGEIYQRADDNENTVRERLVVYKKETQPLIDYYRKRGLIIDIKVMASPEVMVPIVIREMKNFVSKH